MCDQRPCRCSFDLTPVADIDAVFAGPVGAFCIRSVVDGERRYEHLIFKGSCSGPHSGHSIHAIPLADTPDRPATGASWQWDGNRERPTLSPSLLHHHTDMSEAWHGFIRAGRAESC